jgi:NAD(P)-dependent dehydrogenase (short-subunit alcohol dehydrogenase family)
MKTICISGVSRGIGKGLATRYLEDGHRVLGSVRRPENPAAHDLAEHYSDRFVPLVMDVRDSSTVADAARAAASVVDAIDLLICCAGVNMEFPGGLHQGEPQYGLKPLADIDDVTMMKTFEVNVVGVLRTVRAFHHLLVAGSEPKLVIISSVGGSISAATDGGMAAYRVSKTAVNMLSRRLHFLLKEDGIPVLAIHPGWVQTDMGGPKADITIETSVKGIAEVVAAYKEGDAPYQDYRGKPLSW